MKNGLNKKTLKGLLKSQIILLLIFVFLELLAATYLHKHPNTFGIFVFVLVLGGSTVIALRYGLKRALFADFLSFIYILYVGSDRTFIKYSFQNVRGIIMFMLVLIFTTAIVGWLRDLVDNALGEEIKLRELAEEERERLASILNQLPIGVMVADKNAKNIRTNRHMETILGRKLKETMQLEDFRIPQQYLGILKSIRSGKPVKNYEMNFVRPDKKRTFIRVDATPIFNKKNRAIAWVSAIMDITSQKELESRKDEFINLASHELKTPITSIKLYMDVLEKELKKTDDKKNKKIVAELQDQINRLSILVLDLLDVSRIQTGKLSIKSEEFRLDLMIEDALEVLKRTTNKHDFILKKQSVSVVSDRYRIYQVITNLITNAIKYSSKGSIIVTVKKDKNWAVVSVKDFGVGIDKGQQTKIFERLYQVGEKDGSTYPGLGLGLYISNEIVKRNNGKMWVESKIGKGSTFYFSLPLKNKV